MRNYNFTFVTGVIPDGDMEDIIMMTFGKDSYVMKKVRRMNYWMHKFANASPWPLPKPVPNDTFELAKLAVARMCSVDQASEICIYDTKEVKDAIDDTWIVSGQSVHQRELVNKQPDDIPLKVEGPSRIFLRDQSIDYFVLKADPIHQPEVEPVDKDGNYIIVCIRRLFSASFLLSLLSSKYNFRFGITDSISFPGNIF